MPRRDDLKRILLIGSGPIVIGQGAEFDYSGTQAAKALREEGYEVILVNSNPATIMTDPELADRTYIEPVTPEFVELIIARERPDALLPTMGGQTALNVAMTLHERGVLEKYGVELIGANARAIAVAEDRKLFGEAMERIGLRCPQGRIATTWEEALEIAEWTGFPAIIRPAFTLGGSGGGIAYNREEYERIVKRGLAESPISQVLIERSLIGWKEYELEVMRDSVDNVVIICSIENIDPMGVHTGDSITCAPAMTLSDREYQAMRDAALKVFEPVLDYVVVKVPRFAFEKFPGADPVLTTQMKSVGESMAIGRTFKEAFQKGLRALETGRAGWVVGERPVDDRVADDSLAAVEQALAKPVPERVFQIKRALLHGMSVEELHRRTGVDPWFLRQFEELVEAERAYAALAEVDAVSLRHMKRMGFSDRQLAALRKETEGAARTRRWALGVRPSYKMVDTCAGEFPSNTPYLYSSYDEESEAPRTGKPSVIILGSGPNRIGQGVEFDYCCVRAALALREAGYETIMVNSNPETVSTDYDTSDKLYFEPLTFEDVLEIVEREQPLGVIVQLGGQTPLKLVKPLEAAGVRILGTSPDAIDIAEDRKRFEALARELGVMQPPNGTATSVPEAVAIAERIGYPVLVRPSYVLGGRAMEIVYDEPSLREYFERAVRVSEERPVLVDAFLEDAFEADVDALSDGKTVVIGGVMQHIEDAGIHSGDSACVLPPHRIAKEHQDIMRAHTIAFAKALGVVGLINVQYAVKDGVVYVIEVNPRASRTVPFVSKTIGRPLASLAARVMLGETLEQLGYTQEIVAPYVAVKEAVFPFTKFREFDPILGPEMRSTGEVMGISRHFGEAFGKSQLAAGNGLPREGHVMLTVNKSDKAGAVPIARRFRDMGFGLVATHGTADHLESVGIASRRVFKVSEGRPHGIDLMVNGEIQLLINTPLGKSAQRDDYSMRQAAVANRVPYTTTLSGADAACAAIESARAHPASVKSLQEWQAELR